MEKKMICPKCGSDEKVFHDFLRQYSKQKDIKGILLTVAIVIKEEDSLDGEEHVLDIDFDVCDKCNTFYAWRIYKK